MELPKNITQIGEPDLRCKVYIEDYVISYLKQVNRQTAGKSCAVALYGNCIQEGDLTYFFAYGGCKTESVTGPLRHLSQAQKQEIEKKRAGYFPAHQFIGYYLADGNPIEGFYLSEQDNCRYIKGYACFYEKNEAMLSYMLEHQETQPIPESYDREKFTRIRDKHKNEKEKPEEEATEPDRKHGGRLGIAVAVMALAAGFLYAGLPGRGPVSMDKIKQVWNDVVTPEKEPVGEKAAPVTGIPVSKTITADEDLELVLLGENDPASSESAVQGESEEILPTEEKDPDSAAEVSANPLSTESEKENGETKLPESSAPAESSIPEIAEADKPATERSYVIKEGDTLSLISTRQYGTISKVSAICEANHIVNPDNIQIGQKIVLP